MTDPTPVASTSSATPRTLRDEFRVQLLTQLPKRFVDQKPDYDYDPEALAAWALEQVDAMVAAAGFGSALEQVEALEQQQAELVMFAGATSTFTAMAEWHSYLSQLHPVLQRNMAIAEQWDLSRTIKAEADRVQGVLLALLDRFPQLEAVLGEQIGRRAQGLVDKAGQDL